MKKYTSLGLLFFCCCLLFAACNTVSPEKYFEHAVLNSNLFVGFAADKPMMELRSPSVKMTENKSKPVAMKRSEVINTKIQFIEASFEKVKNLKETDDTKDMLRASMALYNYVLPIYKTEYVQLAKLYDDNVSEDQITAKVQSIHNKYYSRYEELHSKLINIGELYAEKHGIKVVTWGAR